MGAYLKALHAVLAWLFVAAVAVQVFLAGMFSFGDQSFRATHAEFGFTWVGFAALGVLVSALLARPGRRQVGLAALLIVLYIVQASLPGFRTTSVPVAALHPVNALLVFGLGVVVARRATTPARESVAARREATAVETVPSTKLLNTSEAS
jgi:hypothetical protein